MWASRALRALSEPLRALYLRGPTALFFFGGLPPAEICVRLAPRSTHHDWLLNPQGCEDMIERDIESWLVLAWVLLYVYVFWNAAQFAVLLLLSQLRAALTSLFALRARARPALEAAPEASPALKERAEPAPAPAAPAAAGAEGPAAPAARPDRGRSRSPPRSRSRSRSRSPTSRGAPWAGPA